jgi:hypothetical protein
MIVEKAVSDDDVHQKCSQVQERRQGKERTRETFDIEKTKNK